MGITVAVKVANLALPKMLLSTPSEQSGTVLIPNVESYGTVKSTVKEFIKRNLFIPEELQLLQAPLFRRLSEKDNLEDIYKRYACHTETEDPDLQLDEQNFVFFVREGGRSIDLDDNLRLEEYHILEKSILQLRRLPQQLPEDGGRIFVETKDGILPLLGVNHATQVLELKHALERMIGIPVDKQLLYSVGRSMHDGLCIKDFDGHHKICLDSTLDLCKSGDSNVEQGHLRMVIHVNVMGEESFTMVVQGRDLVQSVQQVVQARTGVANWQQRITYSGKVLQETKMLSDYFVNPDCTLQVTIFRTPSKPVSKTVDNVTPSRENSGVDEQKPAARKIKLLRTNKGHIIGTVIVPVLTTDTISDLKRKVRRTLQPLTERNFVVLRSPGDDSGNRGRDSTPAKATPSPSGRGEPLSLSGRRSSRVSSYNGRISTGGLGGNNSTINSKTTPGSTVPLTAQNNPSPARMDSNRVARVLSYQNLGPMASPSEQSQRPTPLPVAIPLFPPPLRSPTLSPTKLGANFSAQGVQPTQFETKHVLTDDLPHLSSSPVKFGPIRQDKTSTSPLSFVANVVGIPSRGHVRAASLGRISVNAAALHSLPEQPPSPTERILPHTSPLTVGSYNSLSPSKSSNGGKSLNGVELHCLPQQPLSPALYSPSKTLTSLNPTELHSLPKQPLSPRETLLSHTAPMVLGSYDSVSPLKSNSVRMKEATASAEKRCLSSWLTTSMHSLKEHIKSPFTERS